MQQEPLLWQLEIAFHVQCVRCFHREEAFKPTQEAAIAALASSGWQVHEIGPWCPECAPLLTSRRGRARHFNVGEQVCSETSRHPLGTILRIGEGYAQLQMFDGSSSVYCLCELISLEIKPE
jgi:hypothetical protein